MAGDSSGCRGGLGVTWKRSRASRGGIDANPRGSVGSTSARLVHFARAGRRTRANPRNPIEISDAASYCASYVHHLVANIRGRSLSTNRDADATLLGEACSLVVVRQAGGYLAAASDWCPLRLCCKEQKDYFDLPSAELAVRGLCFATAPCAGVLRRSN